MDHVVEYADKGEEWRAAYENDNFQAELEELYTEVGIFHYFLTIIAVLKAFMGQSRNIYIFYL